MSRLSRALKRLKGKTKQSKDENAFSIPSTTEVSATRESQSNAAISAGRFSRPVSTLKKAASEPKAQLAWVKSPNPAPGSEPRRKLQNDKDVNTQDWVSKTPERVDRQAAALRTLPVSVAQPWITTRAPEKVLIQPSSLRKVQIVSPQSQPAPNLVVAAPSTGLWPTPKVEPHVPKPASSSASIPKPAIQTHAGLYSGFTPSVAAVNQPAPKTLYNAQKAALDELHGPTLSSPGTSQTSQNYPQPETEWPFTRTSSPSYHDTFSMTSYASPIPYSATAPVGKFHTGGPLGGGQFPSTGGAIAGGTIAQTGGRFGEGSVSKTGGSLGEALGFQGSVGTHLSDVPKMTSWGATTTSSYPPDPQVQIVR